MSAPADTSRAVSGARESDGKSLLAVSQLTRRYGTRTAVDDVSFTLGPGIAGLLGPNGAGKSSLMTCMAGIAAWDAGTIRIGDADVARNPRAARKLLGFMPERVAFPNEMRVTEYLAFAAEAKRIPRAERSAAVELAISRTGLGAVPDRIVGNLSKGNKQRVGMAQALMGDPLVTILDEPMNGLDPLNILDMRSMLQEYGRTRSVIVSTHLLTDARLMCNNVLVMALGKLVYRGAPSEMAEGMGHAVRLRIRIHDPGVEPGDPGDLVEGTSLIAVEPDARGVTALVQARDDAAVAELVRAWSAKWPVTTVESTADSLEEAFREAVLGSATVPVDVAE
ncbi:ABC transporter ATP-binding protein [Sporichthya polymorpha]|uniref:ABC transporter ATP-binding protein n=1 Tax=Sporichthya polymorpha TaxID=35751 RepID=UPI000A07AA7B|nr:ABC transporter ATP-binding protein [Sporichthya polymorpha]